MTQPSPIESGTDDGINDAEPEKDYKAEYEKYKALSRQHEARAKSNAAKAKEYDALEASAKSELQRAVDAARTEGRNEAEVKALRLEVALDKGLPKALAVRLQGSTLEELEADADELLKLTVPTPPSAPRPDLGQGARTPVKVSGAEAGRAEAARRFSEAK